MHITRSTIRATHDSTLYIFGDDYTGKAFRGQAEECAGESNAIPIYTRIWNCSTPEAQIMDTFFDAIWHSVIDGQIAKIATYLVEHPTCKSVVVLPKIGQGCSGLILRAPKTYAYIMQQLKQFSNVPQ